MEFVSVVSSAEALAPLSALLTPILESADEGVAVVHSSGRVLFGNPAMTRLMGDPLAPGWPCVDVLFSGDGVPCTTPWQPLGQALAGEAVAAMAYLRRTPEGEATWISVRAWPLPIGAERFAVVVVRDVTEQRRTLEAVSRLRRELEHREEERRAEFVMVRDAMNEQGRELERVEDAYRQLFERNPRPMWVFDVATLGFLAVNDAAVHHYGYRREEFLAMTIRDIRPADDVAALEADVNEPVAGLKPGRAWRHRRKDGEILHVEVSRHDVVFDGRPARLVLVEDLTQRKRLEQQLHQAQKMEAIGRLAGGIAHDFNNMLTAILSFAKFAKESIPAGNPALEDLDEVLRAGQRAVELTTQLLAFSRQTVVSPQVIDLNAAVVNIDKMLRRTLGADIELVTLLGADLWCTRIDPAQVEQLLLNLALNARDAMPAGGKLTIETANVSLGEDYAQGHANVVAGDHVMLAVSDDGIGMDDATQARIFEPFFTTKAQGKGTGLGLATCYGIVKQAGGNIWLYSEPGRGTTFKVYLPRTVADGEQELAPPKAIIAPRGSETILVAEDDPSVRATVVRVLRRLGYNVIETAEAEEATSLMTSYREPIHLLLTDVVMPHVGGRELARRVRLGHPETRVLFMSGYTDSAIVHHGDLEPGMAFLQKPFMPDRLACKVREVLDQAIHHGEPEEGAGSRPNR